MPDNPLNILEMLTGDSAFIVHNYLVYATTARFSINIGGNSNVTLSEADAAHYQLAFTGAITANIIVYVPQKEKPYIFVNATTGAFTVTVFPVTSGAGEALQRGMYHPITCDGVNMVRQNTGNATVPEAMVHLIEADGVRQGFIGDTYWTNNAGTLFNGRHARGTKDVPIRLVDDDRSVSFTGHGWGRDAANTVDQWVSLGTMRVVVDSVDAQGRQGGAIEFLTNPGVSGTSTTRMRLNEDGSLTLGNPVTGTDKVILSTADMDGVAGQHSLQITDETGVVTTIGKGLLARLVVEANTAGSGSPNILTASESGKVLTNEGVTARNYHNLPSAVAGLVCGPFICQDVDGMRINAASGDTIRIGAAVSAAAGRIDSNALGDNITLCAINVTEWHSIAREGTWTVT